MQKLIYQNLRGEQVEFGNAAPYILCKAQGLGISDAGITASQGSGQNGRSVRAIRREHRTVTLTVHLRGHDREDMYRLRRELCGILSPDKAFDGQNRAKLLYENDYGTFWTWAVPEGGLDWGSRVQDIHPQIRLAFSCESPFWYGTKPHQATFQSRRAGFTLPMQLPLTLGSSTFSIPVQNNGHAYAPVTVTIEGHGEKPVLVNRSTGAQLRLVSPLPVSERLVVVTDPSRLSVTVESVDGQTRNAFGLLDPETSIADFRLRPGENMLVYKPDGDRTQSVIRIQWHDCYEGV